MAASTFSTHLRGDDKIKVTVHKSKTDTGNEGWIDIECGENTVVIFASIEQIEMMGCDVIIGVAETKKPT